MAPSTPFTNSGHNYLTNYYGNFGNFKILLKCMTRVCFWLIGDLVIY